MDANTTPSRRGFTLVELLVVVAILGVLAALLLPVLARAKAKANRVKCVGQLGQVSAALIAFSTDHGGRLPWQLTPTQTRQLFGKQHADYAGHPAAVFSLPALRANLGSAAVLHSPCDAEGARHSEAAQKDWGRYDPAAHRVLPARAVSYVLVHGADTGRPTTVLMATRNLSTCDLGTSRWSGADENPVPREAISGLNRGQGQLAAADGSARLSDDADIGQAGREVRAHRESAGGVTVGRANTRVLGCCGTPAPVPGQRVPNLFTTAQSGKGKQYVFIIDCSGSMRVDQRLKLAKTSLFRTLETLDESKEFYIYFYNNLSLPMEGEPRPATEDNIAGIKPWVRAILPVGGTDPRTALRSAFTELEPSTIWLLTDGIFKVGNDKAVEELIDELNADRAVRVNTVGFGRDTKDVDESLAPIAEKNGGTYEFIRSGPDP